MTRAKSFVSRNKKLIGFWLAGVVAVLVFLAVSLYFFAGFIVTPNAERADRVAAFIHEFETKVPLVSLASTTEEIHTSMDTLYTPYLSDDLLAAWKADPATALGDPAGDVRYAAIRVKSVRNVGVLSYVVKAYLREERPVTIPGLGSGMAKREVPVTFGVAWRGLSWKIVEYSLGHGDEVPTATTTPQ